MAREPQTPPAPPEPRPVVATVEPAQSFFSPKNVPFWASVLLAAIVAVGVWAKQQAGG